MRHIHLEKMFPNNYNSLYSLHRFWNCFLTIYFHYIHYIELSFVQFYFDAND
jgi:hypothetical protein